MPRIDSEKFYKSAIDMHGTCAKGVGWISKESQETRFDVILDMLPQTVGSIADAGCGFGDFYIYLNKKNRTPKSYIGIDSITEMCSIASKNTAQEILKADICKDEIPHSDYYVCSGAMNVLNTFETHLFIRNCFMTSKKGFIFNILYGDVETEIYNYITKTQLDEIARELDVKEIKLKDDYMQNDITVGLFK